MSKIIRNLIGILLIATAIAVTQIPVSGVEAAPTASASDFQMDGTTLAKYKGTAEDVSVSNYVEKIEAEAFAGNEDIRHVTIGDSVEVIGARAFSECKNLESVTIPDSVKTIDTAAFSGCPSLKEVTVGTGLTSLGTGVFAGAYSLENVRFSSSNPKFTCDDGAILNKDGRDTLYQFLAGRKGDSYTFPSTVKTIKPYAFWGSYNLEEVSLGSQVKEIPAYAFSTCRNLKEVEIPFSVKNIDMKAFEDCVRLREITIPGSVSSIHSTAFDGCTKLEIKADAGTMAYNFAQSLELEDIEVSEYEEAPIPESVSGNDVGGGTGDGDGTNAGNSTDTGGTVSTAPVDYYHEVSHMNAMEEEDDSSVKGKTRVIGQQAYVIIDNAAATINVGSTGETIGGEPSDAAEQNTDTVPGLAGSDNAKDGSFPKYTIVSGSDGKDVIAAQAYYDDEMTSYTIPESVGRIGEFSFARSGLESITIPDGVEEIGYAAFYHCDNLADVNIPKSVRTISAAAFEQTPWLSEWKQNGNGDFLIVGDGILLAYKGSNSVVSLPDSVRKIGPEAFKDNESISKVILPDSVEEIGEAAFAGCGGLTAIEGGSNVRKICDRAFADCPITTIHIADSVEEIGLRAFDRSDTTLEDENRVVVFEGGRIPELSYETMSTRLYRDSYRDLALKGSNVAVVPDTAGDLSGTVLDDSKAGFTGVVCKMGQEPAEGGNGVLQIISRQGSGALPQAGDTCRIDGNTYVLEESGQTVNSSGNSDGAAADGNSNNSDDTSDISDSSSSAAGITVQINSSTLAAGGTAGAVLEGADRDYILTIDDSNEAKLKIGDVYKKIYGNTLPRNLCAYEISMTEADTGVPITGLGKQSVEVTIPMPDGVNEENLHVVCLDADGQLEEVKSRVISSDGIDAITFTAKHFSPYGVYNYGTSNGVVADVKDGQAVFASLGNKDDSPDTGDYSIHPKWFLSAGLAFAAMAMFCYRGGRRSRKEKTSKSR